jgi:predicted secreted protein
MSKRKDPDWFLKLFFYLMLVTFGLIVFLAASVYSKTSTWDNWLREDIVGDQHIFYDDSINIQAPYRAMDPSGVEISIRDISKGILNYTKLTLVIDENPTPCCAEFEFHGITPHILTNVRVNAYTYLTVLSESENMAS